MNPDAAHTGKKLRRGATQVQERAVKRHKNLRLLSRDQDKEALRNAPIIIAAKASPSTSLYFGCALVSVRIRILQFIYRRYRYMRIRNRSFSVTLKVKILNCFPLSPAAVFCLLLF
jgi:hypothetical protein